METGLLQDYFGKFSTWDERYYFPVERSMHDEIEPKQGKIETNIGKSGKLRKTQNSVLGGGTLDEYIRSVYLLPVQYSMDNQ